MHHLHARLLVILHNLCFLQSNQIKHICVTLDDNKQQKFMVIVVTLSTVYNILTWSLIYTIFTSNIFCTSSLHPHNFNILSSRTNRLQNLILDFLSNTDAMNHSYFIFRTTKDRQKNRTSISKTYQLKLPIMIFFEDPGWYNCK